MAKAVDISIRPMQNKDIDTVAEIVVSNALWQRYNVKKEDFSKALEQSLKTTDELIVAASKELICGFAWLQALAAAPILK